MITDVIENCLIHLAIILGKNESSGLNNLIAINYCRYVNEASVSSSGNKSVDNYAFGHIYIY